MNKADLAFVADALLDLCAEPSDAPCFTDAEWFRREKIDRRRQGDLAENLVVEEQNDLSLSECRGILAAASLTARQTEILELRLNGWTFDEIAGRTGRTRQAAQRVFTQGLKKLRRAATVYPLVGLEEVYWAEVRRGLRPRRSGTLA